jgi:hypothetical protein
MKGNRNSERETQQKCAAKKIKENGLNDKRAMQRAAAEEIEKWQRSGLNPPTNAWRAA